MTDPGAPREPNRLIHAISPYLQQHAYNPVDWYPWGEEALALAREKDRPIFLSVGYSSCHWCHVMERESFENDAIARLMNEHFVNIKVDREERPDIDSIYMTAVQLLTGQGGWPMSVFLTPDLRPFWGGTYFPPESRFGRPGFADILTSLARAYTESPGKIEQTASALVERLSVNEDLGGEELPDEDAISRAADDAARRFDSTHGGFGPAPKFPRSVEVSMLFRAWCLSSKTDRAANTTILDMCERTLEGMAHGGMYDQIGGGFHRYSTDAKWLVPHFEKMLYDNALLAKTYLEAWQLTGRELNERIAREVLDYVLREMTSDEGGFYSATDADSEGEEGIFFVWTPEQVEAVVGPDDARLVCEYYGITAAGNFEATGASIPHISRSIEDFAASIGIDAQAAAERLAVCRKSLYDTRESREKPFRDEKVLTAWNGLMISALARGAQVLGDDRYLESARRAADLVIDSLCDDSGRLLRVRKDGKSSVLGFLDDYAYFVEGLLDLWEASFDVKYLREARRLADIVLDGFWDSQLGGLYSTSEDHEKVIARRKDVFDNATPAPSGVMTLNLLRLERLSGQEDYRTKAEEILRSVRAAVEQMPMGFGSTLMALGFLLEPPVEIALVGELDGDGGQALRRQVHAGFLGSRVLAGCAARDVDKLAAEVPLLRGKTAVDGRPTLYVCRDFRCREPLTNPDSFAAALPFADSRKG